MQNGGLLLFQLESCDVIICFIDPFHCSTKVKSKFSKISQHFYEINPSVLEDQLIQMVQLVCVLTQACNFAC